MTNPAFSSVYLLDTTFSLLYDDLLPFGNVTGLLLNKHN